MIDWNKGLSAETYVTIVDPTTWKDLDRIEITGGSISRTDEGLRSAADLSFVRYDQSAERWLRVYLDARQTGSAEHTPLFTGLASSPTRDIYGRLSTNSVTCNSVLQPCSDILLKRGWYAPKGTDADVVLKDLLSVTPAPVEIEGVAPKLFGHIVAEEGETHLTMVDKILLAIDWRMKIKGDGTIVISKKANTVSASFDPLENDSIETDLTVEYDWFNAPNVFRAVTDTDCVTVKDERKDSPLSVVNRREIWMEETDCNLNDDESLETYAERRLREEQMVNYKVSYKRRYRPDVYASDHVSLHYPEQQIDGEFYVVSQSIELGYGATTDEEVIAI